MKVASEITTIMWGEIHNSAIAAAISGEVYKYHRPQDSQLEDVVINTVIADGSESVIQRAVVNVNLHVPAVNTAGGAMPNTARFDTLAAIASPVLKSGHGAMYNYWIENTALIKEEGRDRWYLNIRLRFKYHNTIIN